MVQYVARHPNIRFDKKLDDTPPSLDDELMAKFDDYLGFLELLAHLYRSPRFPIEDIDGIFGYHLRRLHTVPEISEYLRVAAFAFGTLGQLIDDLPDPRN